MPRTQPFKSIFTRVPFHSDDLHSIQSPTVFYLATKELRILPVFIVLVPPGDAVSQYTPTAHTSPKIAQLFAVQGVGVGLNKIFWGIDIRTVSRPPSGGAFGLFLALFFRVTDSSEKKDVG